jgi:nitroreductase
LGTCWICNFDVALLKEQLNIPENIEPIAIIPIGYPNKDVAIPSKNRKNIEDIIKWGKY